MIVCDKCNCKISDKLMECYKSKIIDFDLIETEIDEKAEIWRFCLPCWNEMLTFMKGEGIL